MGMKKGDTRRNHYVPVFLLRRFTGANNTLWAYDTEGNRYWDTSPKGVGYSNDLYTIGAQGKSPDRTTIESWMTEQFDTPGDAAIKLLVNHDSMTDQQRADFIRFVASQMQRTPWAFDRTTNLLDPIHQEMFKRMAAFDEEFRRNLTRDLSDSGTTPEDIEGLFESMKTGGTTVHVSKDHALLSALEQIQTTARELARMKWCFAKVPDGDPDLIIGDHPVTIADSGASGPLGLRNPNIEVLLPLSRRMLACASPHLSSVYGTLKPGATLAINERTMRWAKRFVFAADASDEILTKAVELRGTGPRMLTQHIRGGDKLVIATSFVEQH